MKMCKKEFLKSEGVEEHFRKVQQRMLNFPSRPGVMPLREVFEDDNYFYTVMEKAEGGPLFQSLLNAFSKGVIPATAMKRLAKQILHSLSHVHRHGMLHRDIKPDNIVMHNGMATLIDFDHADPEWNPFQPKWTDAFFGTVRFSAPEAFQGYFSEQSDLYSVGVLLYLLMTGKLPRDDKFFSLGSNEAGDRRWRETVYTNLLQDQGVDWQCDPWPSNPACRDFCQKLLHFLPDCRPKSAEEALAHKWLADDNVDVAQDV